MEVEAMGGEEAMGVETMELDDGRETIEMEAMEVEAMEVEEMEAMRWMEVESDGGGGTMWRARRWR